MATCKSQGPGPGCLLNSEPSYLEEPPTTTTRLATCRSSRATASYNPGSTVLALLPAHCLSRVTVLVPVPHRKIEITSEALKARST